MKSGRVLLDGCWGAELRGRGAPESLPVEIWNLIEGEQVQNLAEEYVRAGADAISTNTFQGSRLALERAELDTEIDRINRLGVVYSRRGANERVPVYASVGPIASPHEWVDLDYLSELYIEQVGYLSEALADGILIETHMNLSHAVVAVKSAETIGIPSACTLVFQRNENGWALTGGESPEQSFAELEGAGACAVGVNCMSTTDCLEIVEVAATATGLPLIIKPNAGTPAMSGGKWEYCTSPEEFAIVARELWNRGCHAVGGCCGLGPQHIQSAKCKVDESPSV
ncbi:MAG: homocysteine S-methyltransferase family protein [Chthonomonadales bacterium]